MDRTSVTFIYISCSIILQQKNINAMNDCSWENRGIFNI